jgi:GNAT superfamily N-acetyltransferase
VITVPMITVRPARLDEREALLDLAVHFSETPPYDVVFAALVAGDRRVAIGHLVDRLFAMEERAVIFVAELDATLIGGLALVELVHELTGEPFVSEVAWWVEPSHRGHRAGPHMLRCAEEWTLRRGVKTLKMVAPIPSQVGRFYERMGFTALETAYLKVF